jgi:hypothetical protein
MTPTRAKQAINDRFIAQWAGATPFTFDNEEYVPQIGFKWVRVTVRHIGGNQSTLGKETNRKFERRGLIFVSVFIPAENGTSEADLLAKAAQDIFEGTRFNGVIVNDSTIREVGSSDGWYQVIMEANFNYFEIK